MQALTERFEMRLDQDTLQAVESWRSRQADLPSRAEAVRRLVELGLASSRGGPLRFSKAEMLIVHMLCELYKGVKGKTEIDPDFVREALFGGHTWGLEWQYTGIFHDHVDSSTVLHEVTDILDMWEFLESAFENLDKKGKEQLAKDAEPFGKDVAFRGFDGNNESEHIGIARFFVRDMGRFDRFKGRDLNSHFPSIAGYRRMLDVFRPIREKLAGRELTGAELAEILKARTHPERRQG